MSDSKLTFSEWWQLYEQSLERLKPLVSTSNSVCWQASYQMIQLGQQLESNIYLGFALKAQLLQAEAQLGPKISLKNGQTKPLPLIEDADSYLFALNYFLHLQRFQNISSSSRLLQYGTWGQEGIESLKPNYLMLAERLRDMLLSSEKDLLSELKRHKRLNTMSGENYFEQGLRLIEAPDVANQMANILRLKCTSVVTYLDQQNDHDLEPLVSNLNRVMDKSRATLGEIANLRLLMELNEAKNQAILNYVRYPKKEDSRLRVLASLRNNDFPLEALNDWDQLVSSIKKRTRAEKTGALAARATGHVLQAVSETVQTTINPQTSNTTTQAKKSSENDGNLSDEDNRSHPFITNQPTEPSLVDSAFPKTNTELYSGRCIRTCREAIIEKGNDWNQEFADLATFNTEDLVNAKAQDLKVFTDKITLLQYMMNLQAALHRFTEKNNTGIVAFSNWGILGLFSRWLSHSWLRPLLHDNLLLMYTVEKLSAQVSETIENINRISGTVNDLNHRRSDFMALVKQATNDGRSIKQRSLYAFFKADRQKAHSEFNQALQAMPTLPSDQESPEADSISLSPQVSPGKRAFRRSLGNDSDEDILVIPHNDGMSPSRS